jgi:hypothetical protein
MAQYTTAKLLTDGDLNPIPQYLDTSDTTDSPEGTFKPLDKVQETSLTGSYQKYLILANAVAITTSGINDYNLIEDGGLTEEQIRQYKRFKFSLVNTHDQPATVTIYSALRAHNSTGATVQGVIYNESNVLAASGGRLIISSEDIGVGGSAEYKSVPALKDLHSNLIIRANFSTAPTSGALTIAVETH